MKRILSAAEIFIIVILALVPVFLVFPYRLNIFLSWEGAYRLYLGQVPYRDFGMPVGYMYWIIPSLFFKIFGPQLITLVKAQAFINILAGLSFRSILRTLRVQPVIIFTGVIVFCLSYSFMNYWPWYNHTVIVYELISLALLMKFLVSAQNPKQYPWLVLSGVFIFFSFFTKQDGGGLGFLLCLVLLIYNALQSRRWLAPLVFIFSVVITGLIMMLPFTEYSIGYWFNHGQPPHSSRISISDILQEFLGASQWIKFYFFLIILLLFGYIRSVKGFLSDKRMVYFTLLTLGMLMEAAVFQVTSYVPEDNNIFFHSFAFVFILSLFITIIPAGFNSWKGAAILTACVIIWWSQTYWKYVDRFILKPAPSTAGTMEYGGYTYSNEVNRNTYMIELDTTDIPLSQWRTVNLPSYKNILLPGPTADGIDRLMRMPVLKKGKDLKVLNMSELTSLASDIPYSLEAGPYYPLWFHKGVGMFDKETDMFVNRIRNNYYDIVLFEYIPYLNNFYPYEVRKALQENYRKADAFVAPRKPSSHAWIEVYVPMR